jgi:uncharacterized protein YwgA
VPRILEGAFQESGRRKKIFQEGTLEMSPYDFVHLVLYAMGGEVRGKTKLQKTAYFAGLLSGTVDELGYRPHFYGPYSAEVAGAVNRLRALGFATQTVVSGGAVDQAGFEVARYDLRLTDEGMKVAQAKAEQHPGKWEKIKKAAEALNAAQEQDYLKLSIAAKTYFMLGQKKGFVKLGDLATLAKEFGWLVTPVQVQEGAQFLQSLGLVTLK